MTAPITAFVQGVGVDVATYPANLTSTSFTAATGDTIVIFVRISNAGNAIPAGTLTVTDSGGNTYTEATGAAISGGSATPGFDSFRVFYSINVTGFSAGHLTVTWGTGWTGGPTWGMQATTIELSSAITSLNDSKGLQTTPNAGVNTSVGTGAHLFPVHISGASTTALLYTNLLAFVATGSPGVFLGFQLATGGATSNFVSVFNPTLNGAGVADPNVGVLNGFVYPYVKSFYDFPVKYKNVFPLTPGSSTNDSWVFVA